MDRQWSRIIALWLIGALAAAQLAKIATLAPLLRQTFRLSLPGIGLLISLLEVGGALLGFAAGLGLGRLGARRSLLAGLATLAAAGLGEAIAPHAPMLFGARTIEGFGYLLVVIAAPTLIAATASTHRRDAALALWSSFVPVGVACGSAITGLIVGITGMRGVLLVWSLLAASGLAVAARLPIAEAGAGDHLSLPRPAVWLSTAGFGCYTLFICGLTMLLPTFLIERTGASIGEAGLLAAIASLGALPGSAIAIHLSRRRGLDRRSIFVLVTPALAVTALIAPAIFAFASRSASGLAASAGMAVITVLISGAAPPLIFARLPILAAARRADDPRIAAANGLITQFGAGGALIGPPVAGMVVGRWGWNGLGLAISLSALAMLMLMLLAERRAARTDPSPTPVSARGKAA